MSSPLPNVECNGDGSVPVTSFAEVVVVRHGETVWNSSRIIQGHLDSELNEAGKNQAILVADRLSKESKFTAVYSSDLKRAAETAQIIANKCNLPEVILDPDLRERHLGVLQGLTLRDASKLKPEAYKAFLSSNPEKDIPGGGESVNQLHQRCTSSVERIARKHIGERILVVTHGGVLRELYKQAVPGWSGDLKVLNTSVNVFHICDSENCWTLETWGDISHLHGTGFPENSFGGDRTSG
uniref:Putative phosphoglycerate mutase GpmB n=1 Tax=Anthurium amnicola TaxID=1678845 RepID=A0A1D1Y9U5_9ARAE